MEWLMDPQVWLAFLTLTILEIVLGIDNIIFISILVGRLPREQQRQARLLGLSLAMMARIALLLSITWVMRLTAPLITIAANEISGRDLILIIGGLFLIGKSTHEIHNSLEGAEESAATATAASFGGVLVQIALVDIVFSLDSVITAVGLVQQVQIMIIAIIVAVGVMMASAGAISEFIDRHPTLKMLALSFLIMIGVALLGEGLGFHIPKGYIYFSMAFSVLVEFLNIKARKQLLPPVALRKSLREETA